MCYYITSGSVETRFYFILLNSFIYTKANILTETNNTLEATEKPSFTLLDTANYNISEYDLALHPRITGNPVKAPKRVLAEVLWDAGMDTKDHSFKPFKQLHMTLAGRVKNGILFSGRERKDKEWLQSGCATLQGHIESISDTSLKDELRKIMNPPPALEDLL